MKRLGLCAGGMPGRDRAQKLLPLFSFRRQDASCLFRARRITETIALSRVAAHFVQQSGLQLCLHSFGDNLATEIMAKVNHRLHNHAAPAISSEIAQ